MTQLLFDLPGDLDLPVEVYDQGQRLVGRTLSSGTVAVKLGRYFVETRLPDGSRRQRTVEVDSEGEQEVFLGPAESTTHLAVSSRGIASSELLYVEQTPIEDMAGAWTETTEEAPRAWLEGFRWNSLGGWQVTARRPLYPWNLPASVRLVGNEGWGALGLQRPDGHTTVIPALGEQSGLLRFELHEEGEDLRLRAGLASEPAQALLNFLNLDLIGDAELLSHSRALQGEYLLREKVADPLAAAAGAVALLRMNELDRLHEWTANLADWVPLATRWNGRKGRVPRPYRQPRRGDAVAAEAARQRAPGTQRRSRICHRPDADLLRLLARRRRAPARLGASHELCPRHGFLPAGHDLLRTGSRLPRRRPAS